MASLKFFPVISNAPGSVVNLTNGQTQSITLGQRVLVRIVANQGVNIRFSTGAQTPTGSDMYLPPNVAEIFDLGDQNDTINIYNSSAAAATIWVNAVTRT